MNVRRFVPFAVLLLVIIPTTACSTGADGTEGTEAITIAGLLGQDTGATQEDYASQESQVQDLIATCMREEGWEYIPVEYPDDIYTYSEEDRLEQIQREGFGIVYWALHQGDDQAFNDPLADWVDPNAAIMEAMSEAERTAYYESLYGTQEEQEEGQTTEIDAETGEEYTIQTGYGPGCQGEASTAVYGEQTQSEDYWEATSRFYEELNERVVADPRIKALDAEWSTCMADAGFDFPTPSGVWDTGYADLQARFDEIVGDEYSTDPLEGWSQDEIDAFFESATQEEIDALFNTAPEFTDEQRAGLEALLADEILLAVSEYNCSQPYYVSYQEIYAEIEEAYATEHQAELEQLAATLESDA